MNCKKYVEECRIYANKNDRIYMTHQEMTFYEALAAAQGEFDSIELNCVNPHYKSKYCNLSSIRKAIQPTLTKYNLAITQTIEEKNVNDFSLVTTIYYKTGEKISSSMLISKSNKNDQQIGSTLTYMRRYALTAMLNIVGDEDDDGNSDRITHLVNDHAENDEQKPLLKAFLEEMDAKNLNALVSSANKNKTAIKNAFKEYVKKACLEVQIVQAEKVTPVQEPKTQESALRKVYLNILECIRLHVDNQKYEKLAALLNKNIASEKENLGEQTAVKIFTEHLNFMTKNNDLENKKYINSFITMLESK